MVKEIIISILIVCFSFEMKEFFNLGGFNNLLAFNLLKLIILGICMIIALFLIKYQNNTLNLRRSNENNNGNEPKEFRKNSY